MNGAEILALFVVLIFWMWTFFSLMAMPDNAFKGRNDKLIWAILVIVTFAIGAVMFHLWRYCRTPVGYFEEELAQLTSSLSEAHQAETEEE